MIPTYTKTDLAKAEKRAAFEFNKWCKDNCYSYINGLNTWRDRNYTFVSAEEIWDEFVKSKKTTS